MDGTNFYPYGPLLGLPCGVGRNIFLLTATSLYNLSHNYVYSLTPLFAFSPIPGTTNDSTINGHTLIFLVLLLVGLTMVWLKIIQKNEGMTNICTTESVLHDSGCSFLTDDEYIMFTL